MYAYLVLGEHAERLVKVGPAEVVIALGGRFKAAINEVHGTVEALLQTYSRIFGGTPKDQLLFVANPYEKKDTGAEVCHDAASAFLQITR